MSVKFCDGDIDSYKTIFKECFPEDALFADFYFDRVHDSNFSICAMHDEGAVSYMAMLPFEADILGRRGKCVYFYAVSTLKSFRGKGYMREMMNFALEKNSDCDFSLLIPAVSGLYERFGFENFTLKQEIKLSGEGVEMKPCRDIKHINSIYNIFRKNYDTSLLRSNKWWDIIIDAALSEKFDIVANDGAYAILKDGYISEFAYVDEFYKRNSGIEGTLHLPVSMARGIKTKNNYVALMLN